MAIDPKLKAEWARKLRESGFVDIELPNGRLKDEFRHNDKRHPKFFTSWGFESRRRYFEVAGQIVEQDARSKADAFSLDIRLPEATQALIRGLHAGGTSNREIERQIEVSRYLIGRVVQAFAQQIRREIENEKAETSVQGATQR